MQYRIEFTTQINNGKKVKRYSPLMELKQCFDTRKEFQETLEQSGWLLTYYSEYSFVYAKQLSATCCEETTIRVVNERGF
jgi:hypothetical protein